MAFNERRTSQREFRLRRADGEYRWVLDSGVPRFAPDGAFAGFIGSCFDITERREAEAELRESEAALRKSHRQNQELAGRLITAQELERARIARELHDDVGQRLASFSIALGTLRRRLPGAPQPVHDELAGLQRETVTLGNDLRSLSHELHPALLEHLGLVDALRRRCEEVSAESGVTVALDVTSELGPVPDEVALCLYRVAQEALRNVVNHAQARSARVELSRQNGRVAMRITDDGRGFEPGMAASHRGLGLISLDERVRMLAGTLAIESSPHIGTTVSVTVPSEIRMPRPRVLVADDHAIMVQGLGRLLEGEAEIVATANDGQQLVERARQHRPDIIVSDINMPGMSGLDAMRRLKADGLRSKFIFLTLHTDSRLASEAMRAGASGYLLKHAAAEELIEAIHAVMEGHTYLTPLMTREVLWAIGQPDGVQSPALTPRQLDVLRLIAEGKRMKEIANELNISVRTVETHKQDLLQTLGLETTADLIKFAVRQGLVEG